MARKLTPDDKYRIVMIYAGMVPQGTEYYSDEGEAKDRYEQICSMKQRKYYGALNGVRLERLASFKLQEWKQVKKMHFLTTSTSGGMK